MKLIPFNCTNPQTKAEMVIYINPSPENIAFVSGGTLPGEVVSFPKGEPVPIEAAIIMLQNGQSFIIKDTVENVVLEIMTKSDSELKYEGENQ